MMSIFSYTSGFFKVLPGDFSVCVLVVDCWFWLGGWVDSVNAKAREKV